MKRIEIKNKRFGRLTALNFLERISQTTLWECICECGNKIIVRKSNLLSGTTSSCGCLKSEMVKNKNFKHGGRKHPLYGTWLNITQRCNNAENPRYKDYGGRGIQTKFKTWEGFKEYIEKHLGEKPKGKSLDRYPDNNGNYEPGNLRWATPSEQRFNSRKRRPKNNKEVTYGRTN